MSLFKDMLSAEETLFRNENALDYDFIPKKIPFREGEQQEIAYSILPLIKGRNGKNLFIHGDPGIGKTVVTKYVLKDLENQTDSVFQIYINCWQKGTSFKIIREACHQLGYKLTHNKNTDELMKVLASMINKQSAVIILDEIDKVEDTNFLYSFLEMLYKKTIVLITNYESWLAMLDHRIRSRLTPSTIEFNHYNYEETLQILRTRVEYAYHENVISDELIIKIAKKSAEIKDLRTGIYLLKESGVNAENRASRKIEKRDVDKAISNIKEFSTKKKEELNSEEKVLLEIIKNNSGKTMGELFEIYQLQGGRGVYKTFQRIIKKLDEDLFIKAEKKNLGNKGNTKVIEYSSVKKLTDFN